MEWEEFLKELLESSFFQECIEKTSVGQQNVYERRIVLLCGSKLLQQYYGEYCFSDKQKNVLASAIEYLTDAFEGKGGQINMKEVPVLIYLAELAQEEGIIPETFAQWWYTWKRKM